MLNQIQISSVRALTLNIDIHLIPLQRQILKFVDFPPLYSHSIVLGGLELMS